MNREKLLWFLDINNKNQLNKNTMKVFLIFDIAFSIFIICMGLLFKCISVSVYNIACVTIIIITTILFFAWFQFARKVESSISFIPLIICLTTLKLFYGYWVFAKGEMIDYGYPFFTWVHMTVFVLALLIAIMFFGMYYKLYKDTKNMTFQELIDREKKTKKDAENLVGSKPWLAMLIVLPMLLPSPYIASKLLKIWGIGEGLGVGFGFWALACIWIVFISFYLPKFIVYKKYKFVL